MLPYLTLGRKIAYSSHGYCAHVQSNLIRGALENTIKACLIAEIACNLVG